MTIGQRKLSFNALQRKLLDSLPLYTFIDLSKMISFPERSSDILLMVVKTVPNVAISFQAIGELPFGSMELMLCGGISCGYVISAAKCMRIVGRNYVALIRRNLGNQDIQRLFIDHNLSILGNDSAIVAVVLTKLWI